MFHDFYQNLPLHIDPIAFSVGSFSVRWYGIMYLVGFLVVYESLIFRIKRGEHLSAISHQSSVISEHAGGDKKHDDRLPIADGYALVFDYLLVAFFSALVGGRIGYVLFYNLPFYIANPLAIVSLYDFQSGSFVGLFGMSYHGALTAVIIASWVYLKKKKIDFLCWADFIVPTVALGYFFGRIGNFLNGELYGRVTDSPLGMYFAADRLNLRHPSQLYEALLEGALLFVVLWNMRHGEFKKGILFGAYLTGYGLLRIFVEKLREPDAQIGFLCNYLTMGQLLSFIMVLGGLLVMIPKKEK